jgi:hypothetical protein
MRFFRGWLRDRRARRSPDHRQPVQRQCRNQLAAANALFGAGNTTASGLTGLSQTAFGNQLQGAAPPRRSGAPAPNAQPNLGNPGRSNPPAARPDPLAAYWSLIPASRPGATAWQPPIFLPPNPFSHENIPASKCSRRRRFSSIRRGRLCRRLLHCQASRRSLPGGCSTHCHRHVCGGGDGLLR